MNLPKWLDTALPAVQLKKYGVNFNLLSWSSNGKQKHTNIQECITVAATDTFEVKNNFVHHSGAVTLADAITALKVTTALPATAYSDSDITGDGKIDLRDAIQIIRNLSHP